MENEYFEGCESVDTGLDNGFGFSGDEVGSLSDNIPDIDTEAIVNSILDW